MDIEKRKEQEVIWLQILYLYIIPTLLFYFNIIPGEFVFVAVLFIGLLLYGITKHERWSSSDFGIRKDFMKDFYPYLLFTIAGLGFIFWLAEITPHGNYLPLWESKKFLLLFVPISFLQELIFRGILIRMLIRTFSSPIFIIALNALIFSFMHVIYLHSIFVLPMTFIGGVGFAWMYYRYPNLILISISHTFMNFLGMILGFFILR